MRIIAHRGNVYGPSKYYENLPAYIKEAEEQGFDVEVDIWELEGSLFFGHDNPDYRWPAHFKISHNHIYHCKNIEVYMRMELINCNHHPDYEYFLHSSDEPIVRTNLGYHWVHPNNLRQVYKNAYTDLAKFIAVLPEQTDLKASELKAFGGICTDYALKYKEMFE